MVTQLFHPLIQQWFTERFGAPTEPQQRGWPEIAAGRHTLIAAPTGSGKTLSAFLVCLDRLVQDWLAGQLEDDVQVVYVSPLKALSNDIQRNLEQPLAEICDLAERSGLPAPPIRVAVRTGDTPASQRQAMLRRPPHILVTTPESLYLLLTSEKARERLRRVRTVIVDEIHALARDKRGSHLALTLERLVAHCEQPPVRIGLSATQKPIEQIAEFLVGGCSPADAPSADDRHSLHGAGCSPNDRTSRSAQNFHNGQSSASDGPQSACRIVDVGHVRELDLALETPDSELAAVCSNEQWAEVYERLAELIDSHRSTLVFVNTRRLAERVTLHLAERLGEEAVASHHGSLSRDTRLKAEQRLKDGQLKAIVATASLEMGIDIGYIDLVCQIGSPRSIATFLQRVGRAGHCLGAVPKGRLFPLTRDELLEGMALVRAAYEGQLDQIEIPDAPLDILAQQIVAEVATQEWDESALYELIRRAWPYRNLARRQYDEILRMLSEGVVPSSNRGKYLHRDRIGGRLRATRGARLAAITSGGAIPEAAEYRVVTEGERTLVGTVDEHFAIDSKAGDVFVLGTTSWRIRGVQGSEVIVQDAQGQPPSIPFWFGEAPGRTIELSDEISRLRRDIADGLGEPGHSKAVANGGGLLEWLQQHCGVDEDAAAQAVRYVQAQLAAMGLVPTREQIVFERFFDESGGMQLVIHAPLGMRINRAWGLALRKRFCRSFDFELQAAADDNGIVLSLSPQHSFPIPNLFKMLGPHNAQELLEQAVLAVPMFQIRWRWNANRALAVLRRQAGKRVPPHLQRFRSEDMLAATFPETVGCLENHHGDIEIPNHPLVQQTMHDCLTEAMDLPRWLDILRDVQAGRIELVACDTREPSPFSHGLLSSNPYTFLDGADLEERRTRAVSVRRTLDADAFRDLARLDPAAIAQVTDEAWPIVRDADELHEALTSLVALPSGERPEWQSWMDELVAAGRAARLEVSGLGSFWITAERWPWLRAVYEQADCVPRLRLPEVLDQQVDRAAAWVELVRGYITHHGPVTASVLSHYLGLERGQVQAALEALEGQGIVLRGRFSSQSQPAPTPLRVGNDAQLLECHGTPAGASAAVAEPADNRATAQEDELQWCDRRLLARIHRLTLDGLRRRIQPVEPEQFVRFLVRHHHLDAAQRRQGPLGLREAAAQLQGFEMPAGAWEKHVLARRVDNYNSQWLDSLFLGGELMWGRLRPPRRDESQGVSFAAMTRMVPISLLLREDLSWLLPPDRADVGSFARGDAQDVLDSLRENGASFFQELKGITGLLPAQLEDALRELSALGLITSDAFAAVRGIVEHGSAGGGRRFRSLAAPAGRWSRFPSKTLPVERADYLQHWCQQLLRRYGVVFRELLTRESAAPGWHELVPVYRRMELRGEVRGGRFVSGVAGEQYATESAVNQLRDLRDAPPDDEWITLSAADPLNLVGILTDGPRLPATHKNSLVLQNGRCIAFKQAGRVELLATTLDAEQLAALRRSLARPASNGVPAVRF